MKFINTRPTDRAAPLCSALQALGHQVINVPLLTLYPLALDTTLSAQYQQFLDADIVVVVSPIAAEIGITYFQQLHLDVEKLKQKKWIAVGKTTAKTLANYGITSVVPSIETSEGMLRLPEFTESAEQTIAFWRGIGGRTLMMSELNQQGHHVINMLLYTRKMPEPHELTEIKYLTQGDMVLITSEASWQNWLQLLSRLNLDAQNYYYVALGDRITEILIQAGVSCTTVYTLKVHDIHQQILKCKTE